MKRLTFLIAALAFTFLFSGCGQSGPLYVPGNPTKMAVPPSQKPADDEEQEEEETTDEASETD